MRHASHNRFWLMAAPLITTFAIASSNAAIAQNCARGGALLNQPCTNAGSSCASGAGACATVTGTAGGAQYTTCKCVRRGGLKGTAIEFGGAYRAVSYDPWGPGASAGISIAGDIPGGFTPYVEIYDPSDVNANGQITTSQILSHPNAPFMGAMQISFGQGPPQNIPVTVTHADFHFVGMFNFLGQPVGAAIVQFIPDNNVHGTYDQTNGELRIDQGAKGQLLTDLFPYPLPVDIRPVFIQTAQFEYDVLIDFTALVPFDLKPPAPGQAGMINTFQVDGAAVGQTIHFVYALRTGSTQIPGCQGATVGLNNPVVFGTAVANSIGVASLSVSVPSAASGRTVHFQTVESATCTVSNLVTYRFP